eukprot:SM001728S03262  [mRNA]  locus=s1728:1143:1638:- [translate_table: standard]
MVGITFLLIYAGKYELWPIFFPAIADVVLMGTLIGLKIYLEVFYSGKEACRNTIGQRTMDDGEAAKPEGASTELGRDNLPVVDEAMSKQSPSELVMEERQNTSLR